MAFVPSMLWKLPFITTWDDSRNQNPPTDSAEEAILYINVLKLPARGDALLHLLHHLFGDVLGVFLAVHHEGVGPDWVTDRKSTRLNSSHLGISYAVFCLKKKK